MPVVNFHLLEGASSPGQDEQLLLSACRFYAEVLGAPMDRVRAFITTHSPSRFAVGGSLCTANELNAPFFEFIVLEGRSLAQRQRLLKDFTELLVEVLGIRREHVRGVCRLVRPEDWGIGGEPASAVRKDEIAARAAPASGQMP